MLTKEERRKEDAEFLELMQRLCMRPAMYVGVTNLYLVSTFIFGYSYGWAHAKGRKSSFVGSQSPINGFSCWVRSKFVVDHPAWGFERILLHHHQHDHKQAIQAIPILFEEFLQGQDASEDYYSVDARLRQAIKQKYGALQGAPDCQECQPRAPTLTKEMLP